MKKTKPKPPEDRMLVSLPADVTAAIRARAAQGDRPFTREIARLLRYALAHMPDEEPVP